MVYFTQGSGEMDFANARRSRNAYDRGLGELKHRIRSRQFRREGFAIFLRHRSTVGES